MPTHREFVTNALGGTGLLGLFLKSEKVLTKSSSRIDSIGSTPGNAESVR